MSERDIENKFSSLSLAFKTDRVSLQERHELQLRQRDIAERNVATEIRQLGASIRWSPFSFLLRWKIDSSLFPPGAWAEFAKMQRLGRF